MHDWLMYVDDCVEINLRILTLMNQASAFLEVERQRFFSLNIILTWAEIMIPFCYTLNSVTEEGTVSQVSGVCCSRWGRSLTEDVKLSTQVLPVQGHRGRARPESLQSNQEGEMTQEAWAGVWTQPSERLTSRALPRHRCHSYAYRSFSCESHQKSWVRRASRGSHLGLPSVQSPEDLLSCLWNSLIQAQLIFWTH